MPKVSLFTRDLRQKLSMYVWIFDVSRLVRVETKDDGSTIGSWGSKARDYDLEPWFVSVSISKSDVANISWLVDIGYRVEYACIIIETRIDKYITCISSYERRTSISSLEIDSGEFIACRTIDTIALDSGIMPSNISFYIFYSEVVSELSAEFLIACRSAKYS